MDNKLTLHVIKRKPNVFVRIGREIKRDLNEIKHESKLGAEAVSEFFFGPKKIKYKKLSNPHQTHTMPA